MWHKGNFLLSPNPIPVLLPPVSAECCAVIKTTEELLRTHVRKPTWFFYANIHMTFQNTVSSHNPCLVLHIVGGDTLQETLHPKWSPSSASCCSNERRFQRSSSAGFSKWDSRVERTSATAGGSRSQETTRTPASPLDACARFLGQFRLGTASASLFCIGSRAPTTASISNSSSTSPPKST